MCTVFRQPDVAAVVTGARLRRDTLYPVFGRLPCPVSAATFRLSDGRLPEFQERGGIDRAEAFLAENPMGEAIWAE